MRRQFRIGNDHNSDLYFQMRIVVLHPGKLKKKKKKDSLMETLQSLAVFSSAVSDFFFVLECLEQRDALLSLPVTAG